MLILVLLLSGCSVSEPSVDTDYSFIPEVKPMETEVLDLVNAHRSAVGLSVLQSQPKVKAVAYAHTDYMISNDSPSHDYYFNRKAYLQENLGALQVGENVGYGFSTATGLVNAWLGSINHKNIIEGDYTHFDISAEQDANGRWYVTHIFIKR